MTNFISGKHSNILAAVLLAAITLLQLGGLQVSPWQSQRARQVAVAATPCQAKTQSQSSGTCRLQQQSGTSQLYSILSAFFLFLDSFTGKMYFLFIVGLLALGSHQRIYRPPRLVVC